MIMVLSMSLWGRKRWRKWQNWNKNQDKRR